MTEIVLIPYLRVLMMSGVSQATQAPVRRPNREEQSRNIQYSVHLQKKGPNCYYSCCLEANGHWVILSNNTWLTERTEWLLQLQLDR